MTKFKLSVLTALILSVFLSACATLNEEECLTVDWRVLGDNDASQGFPQTRLAEHSKACVKHGINPDQTAYNEGWQAGITRFCTPQSGFSYGKAGKPYRNSCPSNLAAGFLSGYTPAKAVFDAEKEVRDANATLDRLTSELQSLAAKTDAESTTRKAEIANELVSANADIQIANQRLITAQQEANAFLTRGFF